MTRAKEKEEMLHGEAKERAKTLGVAKAVGKRVTLGAAKAVANTIIGNLPQRRIGEASGRPAAKVEEKIGEVAAKVEEKIVGTRHPPSEATRGLEPKFHGIQNRLHGLPSLPGKGMGRIRGRRKKLSAGARKKEALTHGVPKRGSQGAMTGRTVKEVTDARLLQGKTGSLGALVRGVRSVPTKRKQGVKHGRGPQGKARGSR